MPNQGPEDNEWEKTQNKKIKGEYRTIDEIEKKNQKNYDIIINNSINFIKSDLLSKAKKIDKLQIDKSESSSSSSDDDSSDSSSSSDNSSDS